MPKIPVQHDRRPRKPTRCGVRVSTWGSHHNAGNGMLDYLDSQWFGGNVGHAAVTLTIPANEKGEDLIKKYCTDPKIPFTKKTITVQQSVLDPVTGKQVKGESTAFQEEVYEIHFSWWPPIDENSKYDLAGSLNVDSIEEWEGVNFEWAPSELQKNINPQVRRYKKALGERIITFGPLVIVHGRELEEEQTKQVNYSVAYINIAKQSDSLDVLIGKLDKKLENEYLWIGFTEKNLLNRFVPDWMDQVKNPQKITENERVLLLKSARQNQRDFKATSNRMSEINDLLRFKEQVLFATTSVPVDQLLLKELIAKFGAGRAGIDLNKELSRSLFPIYNNILKKIKENAEITDQDLKKLNERYETKVKDLKEKVGRVLPDQKFPQHSFDMELPFDEHHVTAGKPPDNVVNLPLLNSNFSEAGLGNEAGMDAEGMLKQMQELIKDEAEGFNLKTKNCSKTVGSILEAGATQPSFKKIFQSRAFGFFGNPQEVYNTANEVHSAIYGGSAKNPGLMKTIGSFNPLEKMGGYLIGVWMNNPGLRPIDFVKKTGVVLGGVIIAPFALLGFTLRKMANPLESFKGALGLINYARSRNFKGAAKILQIFAFAVPAIGVVIFMIPAGLQAGSKGLYKAMKSLFKPKPEVMKKIEAQIEDAREEELPEVQKLKARSDRIYRAKMESKVAKYINKRVKEIESLDPIEALRKFKETLDTSFSLPVFSIKTQQLVLKYINSAPTLPEDLAKIGTSGNDVYKTLYEEAHKRLRKVEKSAIRKVEQKLKSAEAEVSAQPKRTLEQRHISKPLKVLQAAEKLPSAPNATSEAPIAPMILPTSYAHDSSYKSHKMKQKQVLPEVDEEIRDLNKKKSPGPKPTDGESE